VGPFVGQLCNSDMALNFTFVGNESFLRFLFRHAHSADDDSVFGGLASSHIGREMWVNQKHLAFTQQPETATTLLSNEECTAMSASLELCHLRPVRMRFMRD
jgi:hypothetical protein